MNSPSDAGDERGMTQVRAALFKALDGLTDKVDPMPIDRAKAVVDVAQTLINSAKVEVEYLRVAGGGESSFLDTAVGEQNLPPGVTSVTRHRLK